MNHLLVELMPFFAGCTCGLLVRWRGPKGLTPCLIIGPLCAWFAGELGRDALETVTALTVDTATAVLGCALARYALRLTQSKRS